MHKPPKSDRKWAHGLLLNAIEVQELRDILHASAVLLGYNGGSIVVYKGKRRDRSWVIRKIQRFHDKMEKAKKIEGLSKNPIKPSKADLALAEKCLKRLEKK